MNKHLQLLLLLTGVGLNGKVAAADNMLDVVCQTPPPIHCSAGDCAPKLAVRGNVTDPLTGREFFLDYPCDLKPGENVIFILNIHGAGSIANWQRHYFPASDYKDEYRLVVATSTAEGSGGIGGGSGVRMWLPDVDDAHLQNITDQVVSSFGAENIKSMWLAGHSQGGGTSHRLVCTDFFKDKVDGLLSLSGGRIGRAEIVPGFGPPRADGTPPPERQRPPAQNSALPSCEFSHIYATGEHEIVELPEESPWASEFNCSSRIMYSVIDTQAGWVSDSGRSGYPVWGMDARPGTASIYEYPNCDDNRVVADVVRIDKGHTEGLEPNVTERIIQLIASAQGGKISAR